MRDTKLIVMGNLKGGTGKTTITNMFAKYVHQHTDFKIKVIDGDIKQQTLVVLRAAERKRFVDFLIEEEGAKPKDALAAFERIDRYELTAATAVEFMSLYVDELFGNFDIVLYDVPGNVEQPGLEKALENVDCFFMPTSTSDPDMYSLSTYIIDTLEKVKNAREANGLQFKAYYFYNAVNPQMNVTKDYLYEGLSMPGVERLEKFISDAKVDMQNNISTTDFSDIAPKRVKTQVIPLCEEMLQKILEL